MPGWWVWLAACQDPGTAAKDVAAPGDDDDDTIVGDDDDDTTEPTPWAPLEPWTRGEVESPGSVTFTELHYDAGDGVELEWVELHNPRVVDVHLGGWRLEGGVDYTFPAGTTVPARGYLVVASDPGAIPGSVGPFSGRLDDAGERLDLITNGGRRVDSVEYGADEPWPVGPDGSGHTLAKLRADAASDRAEGWTFSAQPGGTPGAANLVDPDAPPLVVALVDDGATWAFDTSGDYPDPAWADPAYDDSAWDTAAADFFAATAVPVRATIRVTADNDCAVYLGAADGAGMRLVGEDSPGDWTTVKSFPVDVDPGEHLFVAAWEDPADFGGPQMAIAEVDRAGDVVGTGIATFDVALGPPNDARGVGPDPSPTAGEVAAAVADADALGAWAPPAVEAPPASAPWGLGPAFDAATNYVWPDTFGDVSVTNLQATWALFRSVDPVGTSGGTEVTELPITTTFRVPFDFPHDPARAELALDCRVDDGAVFWLNGVEVLRHNLPQGVVTATTLATTDVTDDGDLSATVTGLLRGDNVLAVEVHQATADPGEDLRFGCALEARITSGHAVDGPLREVSAGGSPFSVEVEDAEGVVVRAGDAEAVVPAAGLAVVALSPAPEAGDAVFLYDTDGVTLLDAVRVWDRPRAEVDGAWWVPTIETPGAPNVVDVEDDVVIHEIAYHRAPISEDGVPFEERPDEWIELFNRGDDVVDLSGWQLVDAVAYAIPAGTSLAPGAFLVVANDAAAMRAEHPGVDVVGDFDGSLANRGDHVVLRDAQGNVADEVRYTDDGRWPTAADGGGSTLELRDPRADNASAEVWDASDEGRHAVWTPITVQGVASPSAVGPDGLWDEFVMGLLAEGEVLIDDVEVVQDPGANPVVVSPNGAFDDLEHWRIIGNHRHSDVVPDPDDAGNSVLRLRSTGTAGHLHNHAETTLSRPLGARPYQIRLRARWVSGSNLLNTRLYFDRLPQTTRVPRPDTWGTPGAPNSVGSTDTGPTFERLRPGVAVPDAGQPVTVEVTARDPDGVDGVTLWTSVDGGPFRAGGMAAVAGGRWTGVVQGQAAGSVVQLYVEGEDGGGARSTFPAAGPDSRALIQWADGRASTSALPEIRLILTPADADWLHDEVNLMSDDFVGGTVVVDDARVVFDVGVRAKGSERGRPEVPRLGYAVRFHREAPFRSSYRTVLLDRSQGVTYGQREFLSNLVAIELGLPFAEFNDLAFAITPRPEHSGGVEVQLDRTTGLVLDAQFTDGASGPVYDYELIYSPLTTDDGTPEGLKLPLPDTVVGTALRDLGADPEAWRWTFPLKNNEDVDDYGPIQDLGHTFGLPDAQFQAAVDGVIDVDQWMQAFAFATLAGAVDNYGGDGAQHNAAFYSRPDDDRLLYAPHDLDFYGSPQQAVVGSPDLRRLIADPRRERLYYQHLQDELDRGYAPLDSWCSQVAALLPGQDWAGNCAAMRDRAAWVGAGSAESVGRRFPAVPFAITTNGGADFDLAAADVVLEGDGWIDVRAIHLAGAPLAVTWLDADTWQATAPLALGANLLDLEAVNLGGEVVGADVITVTRL